MSEEEPDGRIESLIAEAQGLGIWSGFSTAQKDEAWKALEWGRQFDRFFAFMYGEYDRWKKVAESLPYSVMHKALEDADKAIVPGAAKLISERGLRHVYSMGPSPSVDKLLLEELVKSGRVVTYHPIDASAEAIKATLDGITAHLDDRFGAGNWKEKLKFADTKTNGFGNLTSPGPSCVIYSGGTIMNNREFWQQAASLAQKGGIVVASSAVTHTASDTELKDYWLKLYETKEGREMHEAALLKAFPGLFTEENRLKWEIAFEYVPRLPQMSKYEQYQTPRISVQLRVLKPMTLHFPDRVQINLRPTPTWAEAAKWGWEEQKQRNFPIELIISSKPDIGAFLATTPHDFGMKNLAYIQNPIDYTLDGRRGVVVAAVFSVDNPVSNRHSMEKRGPPMTWAPGPA